ncbi:uncharacterized protein LOC130630080 [Hydractinia symbiolongicarpus]|uniref:uncharacterized protein LOC130630080 n=1 Tax=Hydractinia symbiolongicarpus TaxID=13093 RepID=UPI00254EFD8A|nr:uncharacterized protein LOC130630080 [Hydractinia symbiolongicarpus]
MEVFRVVIWRHRSQCCINLVNFFVFNNNTELIKYLIFLGQPFQHRIEIPVGCDTTRLVYTNEDKDVRKWKRQLTNYHIKLIRIFALQRYADYLKALQFINTRKNEIPKDLLSHLGHENPVSLYVANGRKVYKVRCPFLVCNYMGDRIDRHLEAVHRVKRRLGFFFKSRQVRMYTHLTTIYRTTSKPLPCKLCAKYYDRVDTHFRRVHGFTDAQIQEGLRVAQKISRNFNKYCKKS